MSSIIPKTMPHEVNRFYGCLRLRFKLLNWGCCIAIPIVKMSLRRSKACFDVDLSCQRYAMASLPAIAEGPTAEEQMLMAEASSVSRQTDLQTLRHDKREFIKVSLLKSTSFRSFFGPFACIYLQASTCTRSELDLATFVTSAAGKPPCSCQNPQIWGDIWTSTEFRFATTVPCSS